MHKHRTQTQHDHTNLNTYKARNSTKTKAQGRRRKARLLVSGRERENIHGGCFIVPVMLARSHRCSVQASKDCEKKQPNQSDEDDKDDDGSIDSLQQSST